MEIFQGEEEPKIVGLSAELMERLCGPIFLLGIVLSPDGTAAVDYI